MAKLDFLRLKALKYGLKMHKKHHLGVPPLSRFSLFYVGLPYGMVYLVPLAYICIKPSNFL